METHPTIPPCVCDDCITRKAAEREERGSWSDAPTHREEYYRKALAEIAEGRGPFKRDPMAFATSVIEHLKATATKALAGTWEPNDAD